MISLVRGKYQRYPFRKAVTLPQVRKFAENIGSPIDLVKI